MAPPLKGTEDDLADHRRHPELYRTDSAESDVLNVQPYTQELHPYLNFRDDRSAKHAAQAMYDLFMRYRADSDFVGMDMARKYLEMGWLRCRRYSAQVHNTLHSDSPILPTRHEMALADAAKMFYRLWQKARSDAMYVHLRGRHRSLYER